MSIAKTNLSRANSMTPCDIDPSVQSTPNSQDRKSGTANRTGNGSIGDEGDVEGDDRDSLHIPTIGTVEVNRESFDRNFSETNRSTKLPPLEIARGGGRGGEPKIVMWLQPNQQMQPSPGPWEKGDDVASSSLGLKDCLDPGGVSAASVSALPSLARPRGTSVVSVMTDQSENYYDPIPHSQENDSGRLLKQSTITSASYGDDDKIDEEMSSPVNSMMGSTAGNTKERILHSGKFSSQDLLSLDMGSVLSSSMSMSMNINDLKAHKVNDDEALLKTYGVEYTAKQSDYIRKKDSESRKKRRALRQRVRSGELDVQEEDEGIQAVQQHHLHQLQVDHGRGEGVEQEVVATPLRGTTRKNALYSPAAGDSPPSSAAYSRVMQTHYGGSSSGCWEDSEEDSEGGDVQPNRFPTLDWSYY